MVFVMEGISYGVGDVVIGFNLVVDIIDSIFNILKSFKDFMNKFKILI